MQLMVPLRPNSAVKQQASSLHNGTAHLLSMHLHQVVGGCDDNILWRKFTHIDRELENVSKDLDLPRRI